MNTLSYEAALERLCGFAREAAESIRPYAANMDHEGYRCFLNAMYHYTRHSGDKALSASRNCPPGELRQLFEHMQREEQGHYRLAESDLNGGITVLLDRYSPQQYVIAGGNDSHRAQPTIRVVNAGHADLLSK